MTRAERDLAPLGCPDASRYPMIRPERLTIKAQEAFRDAGDLARRRGNPVVNDAHLLAALLAQAEGVVQPLLQKLGLNVTAS